MHLIYESNASTSVALKYEAVLKRYPIEAKFNIADYFEQIFYQFNWQ